MSTTFLGEQTGFTGQLYRLVDMLMRRNDGLARVHSVATPLELHSLNSRQEASSLRRDALLSYLDHSAVSFTP
jgi:hypothetical protein